MHILITGASGQLGAYLIDRLRDTDHEITAWSGSVDGERLGVPLHRIDLTEFARLDRSLEAVQPDAIIHAAAISAAEAVRLEPVRARSINIEATRRLADWADRRNRRIVLTSTDLVFDGSRSWNRESDQANPILAYGSTKLEAEAAILAIPTGVVARVCLLFGPSKCGRPYFFTRAIDAIARGEPQSFFEDEHRTPLDLTTAATVLTRLAESPLAGLYHLAGPERVSRFELMNRAVRSLGLDATLVRPGRRSDTALAEPRPADVSLDSSRLRRAISDLHFPSIEESLTRDSG